MDARWNEDGVAGAMDRSRSGARSARPAARWRAATLALLVAAAACDDGSAPAGPGALPPPSAATRVAVAPGADFDGHMAAIADAVPGFAGVYFDQTGRMVAMLKEPNRLAEAERAVIDVVQEMGADAALAARFSGMRAERVTYDFRELYEWKRAATALFATSPEMTSLDVDERRNRLVVGVEDASAIGPIRRKVLALGVPEPAVMLEQWGRVRPDAGVRTTRAGPLQSNQSLSDQIRPVIGGVEVAVMDHGETFGCTLGYNVTRILANGQIDPERYFTTASHCTDAVAASTSDEVAQPGIPFVPVGSEFLDPPRLDSSNDSFCPAGKGCLRSDVAVIRYFSSVPDRFPEIAWPPLHFGNFSEHRTVLGLLPPFMGDFVHEIGVTTGHSGGLVKHTCVNITLNPEALEFAAADVQVLTCHGTADYHSDGGDSGGPVVYDRGDGKVAAVGAHHGRGEFNGENVAVISTAGQFLFQFNAADTDGATYRVEGVVR